MARAAATAEFESFLVQTVRPGRTTLQTSALPNGRGQRASLPEQRRKLTTPSRSSAIERARGSLDETTVVPTSSRLGRLPMGERRATKGQITIVEGLAVTPLTLAHYQSSFADFRAWCARARLPDPAAPAKVDLSLADFLDVLLAEGGSRSDAEFTFAAVKAKHPTLGATGGLPRAARALRGFRKAVPAKSRFPMPWPVTAAAATMLLEKGFREDALQILVLHEGYFRPGEVRAMRVEDLVAPMDVTCGSLREWALIVAPSDRNEVSKTQVSDDTIPLDSLEWLGPQLWQMVKDKKGSEYIFTGDPAVTRDRWKKVMGELGLQDVCLYQLRHGGASTDLLTKRRPLLEIMARGRWASTASVLRYAKAGKLQKIMGDLSVKRRRFCEECVANRARAFGVVVATTPRVVRKRPAMKPHRVAAPPRPKKALVPRGCHKVDAAKGDRSSSSRAQRASPRPSQREASPRNHSRSSAACKKTRSRKRTPSPSSDGSEASS